jgi:hypothetical protein
MLGLLTLSCLVSGCPAGWEPVDQPPTAAGWLLIAPPNFYEAGGARMEDRAPLWKWTRLAAFADVADCEQYRDEQVAGAPDDESWAVWSMARCVTAERAEGGRLPPGE